MCTMPEADETKCSDARTPAVPLHYESQSRETHSFRHSNIEAGGSHRSRFFVPWYTTFTSFSSPSPPSCPPASRHTHGSSAPPLEEPASMQDKSASGLRKEWRKDDLIESLSTSMPQSIVPQMHASGVRRPRTLPLLPPRSVVDAHRMHARRYNRTAVYRRLLNPRM